MVIFQSKKYFEMLYKRYKEVYFSRGIVWANQWMRAYVPDAMKQDFMIVAQNFVKNNPRTPPPAPVETA